MYEPATLKELHIYKPASIGGESAVTASLYGESVEITFECYTKVFLPEKPDLWHYTDNCNVEVIKIWNGAIPGSLPFLQFLRS